MNWITLPFEALVASLLDLYVSIIEVDRFYVRIYLPAFICFHAFAHCVTSIVCLLVFLIIVYLHSRTGESVRCL